MSLGFILPPSPWIPSPKSKSFYFTTLHLQESLKYYLTLFRVSVSIFLPIILVYYVIYSLKTLSNQLFAIPLSKLLCKTVKALYHLKVSNFISHSYYKRFRKRYPKNYNAFYCVFSSFQNVCYNLVSDFMIHYNFFFYNILLKDEFFGVFHDLTTKYEDD